MRDPAITQFGHELMLRLGNKVETKLVGGRIELRSTASSDKVDCPLAALGRVPNVEALELHHAGVEPDDHGYVAIDPRTLRAGGAAVLMAGDNSPDRPLMHEAGDEGRIAAFGALQLMNGGPVALPPRRTPISIISSDPDIASAGESFDALDPQRTIIGTARCSARPLAHPGRPEQPRARTARPPLTVLAVGAVVTLATMHRDGWCYVRA